MGWQNNDRYHFKKIFCLQIKDTWNMCLMISCSDISIDEMNSVTLDPRWTKRREEIFVSIQEQLYFYSHGNEHSYFCSRLLLPQHDDVIKWKHFPRYWPFVRGIRRSPVNSPRKGQWRGALMFSLICAWINGWVNNREAGYLRRHRTHDDVTVMCMQIFVLE